MDVCTHKDKTCLEFFVCTIINSVDGLLAVSAMAWQQPEVRASIPMSSLFIFLLNIAGLRSKTSSKRVMSSTYPICILLWVCSLTPAMRLLANASMAFIALPVSIRLISHNVRYATTWPTIGEGEDIAFERFSHRLTTLFNSSMGGPEAPSYCTVPL